MSPWHGHLLWVEAVVSPLMHVTTHRTNNLTTSPENLPNLGRRGAAFRDRYRGAIRRQNTMWEVVRMGLQCPTTALVPKAMGPNRCASIVSTVGN